ncbi:MAG: YfbM family protein [Lachnospiraceae bacterium]|nr:YfbM family protein [Lachnospiraceae bacterium]
MSMIGYYFPADDDMVQSMKAGSAGELMFGEEHQDELVSIDKAWHAIHYVLTGEVWEVPEDNILAQLILGGEPVNDEDMGYGPARLIPKEIVSRLSTAMEEWDMEKFRARFDIKDMTKNEIYPVMSDEDEETFFEYVWENFDALKQFFKKTAEKGLNMLTFLG